MFSVKGKRQRSVARQCQNAAESRRRGRPLKARSDLKTPHRVRISRQQEYHNSIQKTFTTSSKSLSSFESLPIELIQHIFFLCFEVNLPQTSSFFANALSTESTYRALILFAYFDDDEEWPLEVRYFRPAEYRTLSLAERFKLQDGITRCRWFTLQRLRACLPALSWLKMAQLWHQEKDSISEDNNTTQSNSSNDNTSLVTHLPDIADEAGVEKYFQATVPQPDVAAMSGRMNDKPGSFLPSIKIRLPLENAHAGSIQQHVYKHVSVLDTRVIPGWLLQGGPWTEENVALLQLLRRGSLYIGHEHKLQISITAVLSGISNAIQEQHVIALETLLEIHAAYFSKRIDQTDGVSGALTPPSQHDLSVDLFHLAARQRFQSSTMIWLLLRESIDVVPHDDAILTRWALNACSQPGGDQVAAWLLRHMDGTNDYHLAHNEYLFEGGAMVSSAVSRHRTLPAANRFDQELGYCS